MLPMMRPLALERKSMGIPVCMLHPVWVKSVMGGSNSASNVHDSATGLLEVIDSLTLKDTGRFLDYEGKTLPWCVRCSDNSYSITDPKESR